MPKKFKKSTGFTLIELLVTISIIAIVAVIGIVVYRNVLQSGRDAKITTDVQAMKTMIVQATIAKGKTLREITGSNCTACLCRYSDGVTDITDPNQNVACLAQLKANWNKILNASGNPNDATEIPIDPYGNIYIWDENEGEVNPGWNPTGCEVKDTISMAGPNHMFGEPSGNDDKNFYVAHSICVP